MRFQLVQKSQFAAKARSLWDRVTGSRMSLLFFIFSIVHFAIQLSLQIQAFRINVNASTVLGNLLAQGNATSLDLPIQRKSSISLCRWVSSDLDTDVETCHVVWSGDEASQEQLESNASAVSESPSLEPVTSTQTVQSDTVSSTTSSRATATATPAGTSTTTVFVVAASSTGTVATGVIAEAEDEDDEGDEEPEDDYDDDDTTVSAVATHQPDLYRRNLVLGEGVELSDACLQSLNWPVSQLHNTKREDIAFVSFQFWVLGMSMVALLNESIPHILASLLTHVMVTTWAANQITHTANFRKTFNVLIANGACRGAVQLPDFWENRSRIEYTLVAMNAVALVISSFLTWKLVKLYGWQTFKRVGASLKINRVYKCVLTLSITIQLSTFFMFTTVSLWIDQLFNSAIGDMADFTTLYKAASFTTLILLLPWLMMGWFAARRELRLTMFFFLLLSILYLGGWGVMFFATTFRWTFVTWRFFAVMACASVFLTCMSFILGVICRYNFGKGLLRQLDSPRGSVAEKDGDGGSIWDEKRDLENPRFSSAESAVPTFAASYGAKSFYSPNPRQPQGQQYYSAPTSQSQPSITHPAPAVTRNLTEVPQMKRKGSQSSEQSHASLSRNLHTRQDNQHKREGSQSSGKSSKRWVIE